MLHHFTKITLRTLIPLTILASPLYLIRFSIFDIPTNVLEVLVLIIVGITLWHAWGTKTKSGARRCFQHFLRDNTPLRIVLIAWTLMTIGTFLSTAAGGAWHTGLGIVKGWFVVPFVFLLCVHYALRHAIISRIHIFRALIVGGAFVATAAIIYAFLDIFTYDHRLRAFYLSPNHLAMSLAPIIPLMFTDYILVRHYHHSRKTYIFIVFALILTGIVLVLTRSLGGIIAASGGLVLFFASYYRSWRMFTGSMLALSLIFSLVLATLWRTPRIQDFFTYSHHSSLASRYVIWHVATDIIADHPLFGVGPGNFQFVYLAYQKNYPPYPEWAVPQPHNLFLAFWLQTGIIGLCGFILVVLLIGKKYICIVQKKKYAKDDIIVLGAMCALGIIMIHGLVDTPYWKNDLALIFWLLVLLASIQNEKDDRKNTRLIYQQVENVCKHQDAQAPYLCRAPHKAVGLLQ